MGIYTKGMFTAAELEEIREKFYYVDKDCYGRKRLFFDNAGGSLRLKKAEMAFHTIDSMPDASEHSNSLARELADLVERGREDIRKVIFNTKTGTIYPSYTASQIAMEVIRAKHGMELRVAGVNRETGGVDTQAILDLVDENTALLCCMAASNISGYIYETEKICKGARKINPNIYIYVDAVQHAPHGALDPEKWGADATSFAPYKFFGVRGFGIAWLSDRISTFDHHRLLGKAGDDWEIGSPATAQFAVIMAIINYVAGLGQKIAPDETDRRVLFEAGMKRIADHERGLLEMMLEGVDDVPGLRHMPGITVQMDGKDLTTRDLILGVEFEKLTCEEAVAEYEKRGVITFERALTSMYSRRMVEAFGSKGMVRLSPLHVNTPEDIKHFLQVTQEMIAAIG